MHLACTLLAFSLGCFFLPDTLKLSGFRALWDLSGVSKAMVCQTYGLPAGRLSRKQRKSRKWRKWRRQLRQLQTRSWVSDYQRFRKGVGGQRGLARGKPSCARDSGIFSASFFLFLPKEKVDTILANNFCSIWGPASRQPPPANRFSKPLRLAEITETTEMKKTTGSRGANHGVPKQRV